MESGGTDVKPGLRAAGGREMIWRDEEKRKKRTGVLSPRGEVMLEGRDSSKKQTGHN